MRRKRILFGTVDIGYRIELYTNYINKYASDRLLAESFSKYVLPASHYKTKYTYTCPIDKTHPILFYMYCFFFFIYSLFRYDIFHFFSGETILTRKLRRFEFWIYKLLGKKIIMHFVGGDIRSPKYIYWKQTNIKDFLHKTNIPKLTEPFQDKLIADTRKYADHILVSTPDLLEIIPEAVYYPVMLDLDKFINEANPVYTHKAASNEVAILHSPSNAALKGTPYIHEVLSKLNANSKYKIKLLLPGEEMIQSGKIYAVSRYELFELYKKADIVIDQLIIGWYGLQSIEALVMGKQVISYVDENLKKNLYKNCPIQIANVNTLEAVIIACIEKIEYSKNDSNTEILDWVKKYHTIENNVAPLLLAWGIN